MSLMRREDLHPKSFFEEFLSPDWPDWSKFNFTDPDSTLPSANVRHTRKGVEVDIAVPGMDKKDFKIEITNGMLMVSSEKRTENQTKEGQLFRRKEFRYHSFSRSFLLPEEIDADRVSAKYEDGILKVVMPVKEQKKALLSKHIKIK